ncbi:hypothetical protein BMF94_4732, partial [Rhodotorula taiwanensis]
RRRRWRRRRRARVCESLLAQLARRDPPQEGQPGTVEPHRARHQHQAHVVQQRLLDLAQGHAAPARDLPRARRLDRDGAHARHDRLGGDRRREGPRRRERQAEDDGEHGTGRHARLDAARNADARAGECLSSSKGWLARRAAPADGSLRTLAHTEPGRVASTLSVLPNALLRRLHVVNTSRFACSNTPAHFFPKP